MKNLYTAVLILILFGNPRSGISGITVQDSLNRNTLIKVDPFRLQIIPPSSGVQFYRNGLVFSSNTRAEDKMVQNQISFGTPDTYFIVYNDTTPRAREIFSSSTVFDVPCDGMTFNKDFTVMYYTKKASKNDPESIYRATFRPEKNGKSDWISDPEPLSFCTDRSVYTHPALSQDGKMMVFSSNRKDSEGGFDIYISKYDGSDWSSPVNAGKKVNSTGDEFSPFLDMDNNLYFSSDGLKGFGGYDLYVCKFNGDGWENPANMSDKINSRYDEFAFTIDPSGGQSAFFTRRMSSGQQSLKLFRVTFFNKAAAGELADLSNAFEYLAYGLTGRKVTSEPALSASLGNRQASEKPAVEKAPPDKKAEPILIEKPTAEKNEAAPLNVPEMTKPSENTFVFRVQFASYSEPKGSYEINAGGKTYKIFEYLYSGMYRACAGEFASRADALSLQALMRKEGYKDAFIAAFRNDERYFGQIPSASPETGQAAETVTTAGEPVSKQAVPEAPPTEAENNDKVIFRVQFASSDKPKGSFDMRIRGNNYRTYEYLYNGLYRSCVGEFSTPSQASVLQQALKLEGFNDSFVVAFKDNKRSLDPALFR
jgi:hypothetical protein